MPRLKVWKSSICSATASTASGLPVTTAPRHGRSRWKGQRITQAPRTMTVAEWLKDCPAGSVISKCDVFARRLAQRKYSYVEDEK